MTGKNSIAGAAREDKVFANNAYPVTTESVLDYSNSYWGDEKCVEIVEVARQAPYPTRLDLRGNRFEAGGAKILAELLKSRHHIVSLCLEWNNIGLLDQGVEAIAHALEVDTRLLVLDLRNNNIGPEGAKALAMMLHRNQTLRQLDLRWNEIGNAGVLAFREVLQANYTLLTLELMGNNSSLKHIEEIEKLLERNRAFYEQHGSNPKRMADFVDFHPHDKGEVEQREQNSQTNEDQLLLQVLAEKEELEMQLDVCKKDIHALSEKIEEQELQTQMLRNEIGAVKEEKNRYQQRESDAKRDTHELKMQLEELENRRRREFEEYRSARATLERESTVIREKMTHTEDLHSKNIEQKTMQIAQLEDGKFALEGALHRVTLTTRAKDEEIEKLKQELQHDRKEYETKELNLVSSHQAEIAAQRRQHELALAALHTQLNYVRTQLEEHQRTMSELKEKNENLQSSILQSKVSHEKEIVDLKKQYETDMHDRIQRSVGFIEAQLDEVRKGRVQLEREVERHLDTIMRLRQESISLQQEHEEKKQSLDRELVEQYKEVREKQDQYNAVAKEKARCEEKLQQQLRRLEEYDTRLARMKESYEERIQELTAAIQTHTEERDRMMQQKESMIGALESQVLQLERELSKQNHEHEKRIDQLTESLTAFIQEKMAEERKRRKQPQQTSNNKAD